MVTSDLVTKATHTPLQLGEKDAINAKILH